MRGRRLGCWCVPERCHAEVIAELADSLLPPSGHDAATSRGARERRRPAPPPQSTAATRRATDSVVSAMVNRRNRW
ncbi:DUF4326 domain-containing protein [Micromonospora kangleipakensis]|uniref:DUF4326 domain-containing protein n=1 Tax=Micromonospora kangleipakensis TaxID=1077942 RepID=UPI003BF7C672